MTEAVLEENTLAFYRSPVTQKLTPAKILGRFKSYSQHAGKYRVQILATGLEAIADKDSLFTGWEQGQSGEMLANPDSWMEWNYDYLPVNEDDGKDLEAERAEEFFDEWELEY